VTSGVVDLACVQHLASALTVDLQDEIEQHRFAALSAFDFPRWVWRHNRKQWWAATDIEQASGGRRRNHSSASSPSSASAAAAASAGSTGQSSQRRLYGSGADKASVLTQRYEMLLQRLLQREEFRAPAVPGMVAHGAATSVTCDGMDDDAVHKVYTVDGLIGTGTGQKNVMGALVQLEEERWSLEDPHACIEVDLSQSVFTMGCFPEGALVLVDGHYDAQRSVFVADFVGFPPPEPRLSSLRQFHSSSSVGGTGGALDWFGLPVPAR
jgi:hypothetical protein